MPQSGMTTESYTGSINWGRSTNGLVAQMNAGGASARTPVKPPTPVSVTEPPPVSVTKPPNTGLVSNEPVPKSLTGIVNRDTYNSYDGAQGANGPQSLATDPGALTGFVNADAITGANLPVGRAAELTFGKALRDDMRGGGVNAGHARSGRIEVE